jgi:hypothetical protein
MIGAFAYGEAVSFWHVKFAEAKSAQPGRPNLNPRTTVAKTNSSPGRARSKP